MWQVLLAAAAAAGSGILAKKFISPIDAGKPISVCNQNDLECAQNKSSSSQDSIFNLDDSFKESSSQEKTKALDDDGKIFRFSCPETGSKECRKNTRNRLKKNGGLERGKKNRTAEGGRKEDQINGKRISICLKKRRTGKHAAGKCEFCASKDNSFGWGVGVGMMYIVSARNAEISRLNSAMDETVKTVQELKAEISRRQHSHNVNVSVADSNKKCVERSYNGLLSSELGAKSDDNNATFRPSLTEDGECASRVDQQPEVLEMHKLEVELESELQKLPWVATEGSCSQGRNNIFEAEVSATEQQQPPEDFENSNLFQYNGVLPAELDQKLCHLLIERQDNQIVELETELHQAHSKLNQKEAELQALKDCVKRLTEFSLVNASDEETEDKEEDVKAKTDEIEEKLGFESTRSTVGMKRTLDYEACICSQD